MKSINSCFLSFTCPFCFQGIHHLPEGPLEHGVDFSLTISVDSHPDPLVPSLPEIQERMNTTDWDATIQ